MPYPSIGDIAAKYINWSHAKPKRPLRSDAKRKYEREYYLRKLKKHHPKKPGRPRTKTGTEAEAHRIRCLALYHSRKGVVRPYGKSVC